MKLTEDKPLAFQERAGCNGGGKGILITEDKTNCLATVLMPKVCYAVDMGGGKSACGIYEEKSPTLTCTHGGGSR